MGSQHTRRVMKLAALSGGLAFALVPESSATGSAERALVVDQVSHSARLHFGDGRQALTFHMREPSGVILLYRLSAGPGVKVRATAQLNPYTVPLWIATTPTGPTSPCTALRGQVTCTVGEEWCPMPEGRWVFRVEKLAGPADDVTLWFRIGEPPGQSAT
jgi:hypothetical protein